jgi:hypothetical protein
MKNAQCKKCMNKFYEKEIYTIQQFQYRKQPSYEWSVKFFGKLGISEWDSFCEKCMSHYSEKSEREWKETKN